MQQDVIEQELIRLQIQIDELQAKIPSTRLLSQNFMVRALSVFGLYLVAQITIGAILFAAMLLLMIPFVIASFAIL